MTTFPSRGPLALRRALMILSLAALPACAHANAQTASTTAVPPAGECRGHGHHGHGHDGPPPNPEEWINTRVAELTQALSLDEAQQTEVRSALTDAHARMQALRDAQGAPSQGHPPDPAWREQAKQIHDQADDRIWAVLRCDQKDRMHAYEREQRQRFFAAHHDHGQGCGCGCQHDGDRGHDGPHGRDGHHGHDGHDGGSCTNPGGAQPAPAAQPTP